MLREHVFGVHAAAGKLRPISGVGGRGDDLAVRGRRGHASEDDRGKAGQRGKAGLRVRLAVGEAHQAGREAGVVGGLRHGRARAG